MSPPGMSTLGTEQISGYMREAVALSLAEVERGGIPFSGLVVHPRTGVLGTGVNRVFTDRDPSAHAEIVALRAATEPADPAMLGEAILLASGEPCGMCYQAAFEAGISTILYAIDADEAAQYGFDYRSSYQLIDRTRGGAVTNQRWQVEESLTPFTTWAAHHR